MSDFVSAKLLSRQYFVWQDPAKSIAIRLNLNVIDQLGAAVMASFGSNRGRGKEVGGLLLGRVAPVEERQVIIEGFDPLPSQHLRGESFVLSAKDITNMQHRMIQARWPRGISVIGYYRSHTRPGMYLDKDDFSLASSFFRDPSSVVLLLKPEPGKPLSAGFFFWEDEDINRRAPYSSFPFHRRELLAKGYPIIGTGEARPDRAETLPEPDCRIPPNAILLQQEKAFEFAAPRPPANSTPPAAKSPQVPEAGPPEWRTPRTPPLGLPGFVRLKYPEALKPASLRGSLPAIQWLKGRRGVWPAAAAAVLLAIGVSLYRQYPSQIQPAGPPEISRPAPAQNLALQVERTPYGLRLSWNTNAPALRNANLGLLRITDGDHRERVELTPEQLAYGNITYAPKSEEVSFQLDLMNVADRTSGSVRMVAPSIAGLTRPTALPEAPAAAREADAVVRIGPPAEGEPVEVSRAARPVSVPVKRLVIPQWKGESDRMENLAIPPALPAAMPAGLPVELPPIQPSRQQEIVVTYRSAPPGKLARAIGKIPVFGAVQRRRLRDGEGFVPAEAVTRAEPDPLSRVPYLSDAVELKVSIGKTGKVEGMELLSPRADREFVAAASRAAGQWSFKPARLGDEPVASEVILRFDLRTSDGVVQADTGRR